ncbi:MAG: protein kinase, partial [Myxococcota bacterium]|nr:protein kinase [Myxococcota bacterium]
MTASGLGGRYQILDRRVASTGIVYRAIDPALGRDVHIRAADDATLRDPARLERFVEEARRLARVQDPNVLQVLHFHDRGELDEGCYLVLDRLDRSLEDVLRAGDVPRDFALEILRQGLQGLKALHLGGLVHRALRPDHLHLADRGARVCVGGVALGGLPEVEQRSVGAVRYAAPELLEEQGSVNRRCDLYALGMIAWEMLAGRDVFQREFGDIDSSGTPEARRAAWIRWHTDYSHTLAPLAAIDASISPALSGLIESLTSKPRRGRPAHAASALSELLAIEEPFTKRTPRSRTEVQTDYTVEPRTIDPELRKQAAGSRLPLSALAAVAALLAAILAGIVWLGTSSELEDESEAGPTPPGPPVSAEGPPEPKTRSLRRASAATGSAEMKLVLAEPAVFEAGSRPEEIEAAMALCRAHRPHCERSWYEDETAREVRLQPFLLDVHEVTRGEFSRFVSSAGHLTTAERIGYAWAWDAERRQWRKQSGETWRSA